MNEKRSFEEELERLEHIVRKLEGDELSLEESVTLFEEGARLVKSAQKKLVRVESKVMKIVKDLGGEPDLEDFEVED